MAFSNVFIPYGAYWSSPFCRWQGSLGSQHAMKLAAVCTTDFLQQREITPDAFDGLVLGLTVHQKHSFYGAPWLAGMIGAPTITGPTVQQACATSARMVATAALEVEVGQRQTILTVGCDRTSNGPHVYYPDHQGIGGMGEAENPVWDNFNLDPYGGTAMIQTAENVAKASGITKEEQDQVTAMRYQQYGAALADDRAFQKRYMIPVTLRRGRKILATVEEDEGIRPTTLETLAKLRPVLPEGTVSFGSQTHPADGNAGMVVCSRDRASTLSRDASIPIQILSYGEARVEKTFMPTAVVPAARKALENAGISAADCAAFKTHNPFAINDLYFEREMGVPQEKINNYGSSLVYGHPQGPTGLRAMIELIEELVVQGGGLGLFSGCAAGDSAMAVVLKVG